MRRLGADLRSILAYIACAAVHKRADLSGEGRPVTAVRPVTKLGISLDYVVAEASQDSVFTKSRNASFKTKVRAAPGADLSAFNHTP